MSRIIFQTLIVQAEITGIYVRKWFKHSEFSFIYLEFTLIELGSV